MSGEEGSGYRTHNPLRKQLRSAVYSPLDGKWVSRTGTIADFPYEINFVAGTARGGTQPYGNNNNDGRFFRDSGVSQAAFIPDATGALVSTAAAGMRRSNKGTPSFANTGMVGLWNRDLTNAVWTKTNMTASKTATGADGAANAATRLTATANAATCTQAVTVASSQRVFEPMIRRVSGTGQVTISIDGVAITDITASLTSSYKPFISAALVTNPTFAINIATSGDAIDVDFANAHGQVGGLDIGYYHFVTITSTSFGSLFHETPWALNTDAGPLSSIIKGAYAVYWQGYNYVPNAGGLWVSDGVTSGQLIAGNNVTLAAGVNLNTTGGEWRTGENVNKVAAWLDASGNMALCVNGGAVYTRSGGSLSPSATHFVLSNNGAATLPLCGWTERFAIGANLTFTAAQMQAMTT
jgi:hypothetical protein